MSHIVQSSPKFPPLTRAQEAALALTPIYQQDFPKAGLYTLSTVAPGFSSNTGWMIIRFVCTTLPTASGSQYPAAVIGSDSNSNDAIGFRINNATTPSNLISLYLRASSTSKTAEQSLLPCYANQVQTVGVAWNSNGFQYLLNDGHYDSSTQTSARGMTMTQLRVGSRNGGSDALVGEVQYLEIGNTYITPEQLAARMGQVGKPVICVTVGQSNIQNWQDGVETTAPSGHAGFVGVIENRTAAGCPGNITLLHSAEGGSALWKAINATEYWLEDNGQAGPELLQTFDRITYTGLIPQYFYWDQGESESHYIDHASYTWLTKAAYKARVLQLFNLIRQKYGNVEFLLGILGRRTSGFTNTGGIQKIAEAQQELIDEYPWIHFGHSRHDLTVNADGVHYQDAAYTTMGQRAARSLQRLIGYSVTGGTLGPRLVSASRSGTSLTITIEHDAGTDFTPTTGIEGFKYLDANGADVALSSVARGSATTITATLASAVAGTLYHIYDDAGSVATANMVVDNGANALPLRRGRVSVA